MIDETKYTEDKIGKQYGHLTIIRLDHRDRVKNKTWYLCQCDCGKQCVVPINNLTSGHTKSCGHLVRTSEKRHKGFSERVHLADKDWQWIRNHYKNTPNPVIIEKYHISAGTLHRFARKEGLVKTKQFVKKTQLNAAAKARESHIKNGTYPPKGYRVPNAGLGGFRKGVSPEMMLGKKRNRERIEHLKESFGATIKAERVRIACGFPQHTKLRLDGDTQRVRGWRSYLRKKGYVMDPDDHYKFYYNESTVRSTLLEERCRPFTFMEEEKQSNQYLLPEGGQRE